MATDTTLYRPPFWVQLLVHCATACLAFGVLYVVVGAVDTTSDFGNGMIGIFVGSMWGVWFEALNRFWKGLPPKPRGAGYEGFVPRPMVGAPRRLTNGEMRYLRDYGCPGCGSTSISVEVTESDGQLCVCKNCRARFRIKYMPSSGTFMVAELVRDSR
jgi:hypothetical protein